MNRARFLLTSVLGASLLAAALLTGCTWSAESDSVRIRGGDHSDDPHNPHNPHP